jgi:hypothetical protein
VRDYHPILRKEAILLVSALLANPEAREKHFQRASASATMSILYDYPTLETENDKTLKEIHVIIDRGSQAAAPGAHLVDTLPWMMLIPDRFVFIYDMNLCTYTHGTASDSQSGSVTASTSLCNIRARLRPSLITFVAKL